MGCDIHLYTERRVNGKWESADIWTPDECAEGDDSPLEVSYENRLYKGRNYNLFAMLADVRNGRGFAGIETGAGFVPICEPRGLPADVCPQIHALSERWGSDGHSHSWQTVAELLAYDWTQTTTLSGTLDAYTFAVWDGHKRGRGQSPEEWSGPVMGRDIKHVDEQTMREAVKEIIGGGYAQQHEKAIREKLGNWHCRCEWKQTYYQCAAEFLSETMPKLWLLGAPENVRIVYWFDN